MLLLVIIQAVQDDDQKLQMFGQLYSFVKRDIEEAIRIKTRPETVTPSTTRSCGQSTRPARRPAQPRMQSSSLP